MKLCVRGFILWAKETQVCKFWRESTIQRPDTLLVRVDTGDRNSYSRAWNLVLLYINFFFFLPTDLNLPVKFYDAYRKPRPIPNVSHSAYHRNKFALGLPGSSEKLHARNTIMVLIAHRSSLYGRRATSMAGGSNRFFSFFVLNSSLIYIQNTYIP